MDLGLGGVTSIIASGTSLYIVQFSPLFALLGGILLAVIVMELLIAFLIRPLVHKYISPLFYDDNDARLRQKDDDDIL